MLSFSAKTKNELCRAGLGNACCQTAELYGMLLFGTAFSNREIRFVTAQSAVMRRIVTLFKRVCSIEVQPALQGKRRVLQITEPACIALVMDKLGYDFKSYITYHLHLRLVDNECCVPAFLRGIFLAAGSIASPEKKCHLEIKIGHVILGREVMSLLLDANMTPKMAERRTSWLLYWKGAGQIEDFLTMIGAHHAAMSLMEAKVEKQLRNEVNRAVNCETANIMKVTSTSTRQIAAIERALASGGLEIFPENLRETVDLRVANPTASLSELAAMFEPPISKPGLSHRLGRIMEIAAHVTKDAE